ncbi:cytochrome ubiquinol oxidase subunit I [bacterium]|nr:cytochrome ubiquinol oxidase subunit I [bacterium]
MDFLMIDWARAQFAMTIFFHFLFVPITLGMTVLVAIMESLYYKTGKEEWKKATKFWQLLLAINFAIGLATGIIHEFEFGTNWSNYSWVMGDVFGAPLAVEGIFAFFIEASFGVVSIFGWKRVSKKFHLFSTWMLAIGTNLSGFWIIVANSFMQHPTGYKLNIETARAEMTSFAEVALQPKAIDTFLHQISSSYLLGATFMITIAAYYLLKKRDIAFAKRSMAVAIPFALMNAYFLFLVGDMQAATVTQMQPTKIAAAEGLFEGMEGAPIVIGILNPNKKPGDAQTAVWGIPFPKLLSILGKHSMNAFVPGIQDLIEGNEKYGILPAAELIRRGKVAINAMNEYHKAKEEKNEQLMAENRKIFDQHSKYFGYGHLQKPEDIIPPIGVTFYTFHIMVGLGTFFMLFFVILYIRLMKGKIADGKLWLKISLFTLLMSYVATFAGWGMAEVGRQPWTVFGLLPTIKSATPIHLTNVQMTFFIFLILLGTLTFAEIKMMLKQIKLGPNKPEN